MKNKLITLVFSIKSIVTIFFFFICATLFGQFTFYKNFSIPINTEKITALDFSGNNRFAAIGDSDGNIYIWDIVAKRQIRHLTYHKKEISTLIFDRENQFIISGSHDKDVVIWDLYTGDKNRVIEDFKDKVLDLAISKDNRILTVSGEKDEIFVYDFPVGSKRGELKYGHKNDVIFIDFNKSNQLISAGKDNQMIVWDCSQLKFIRKSEMMPMTMNNSGVTIQSADLSLDNKILVVGCLEKKLAKGGSSMIFKHNLAFYEPETSKEIEIIENNMCDISFVKFSPDKNFVITNNSGLRNKKLSFWNIQKGIVEQSYSFNEDEEITNIDISRDGKLLLVAVSDITNLNSKVHVFDVSGIQGYSEFDYGKQLVSSNKSNFGGNIKLTTPGEPLINFGEPKKMAVIYLDALNIENDIAKISTHLLESKLGNSPHIVLIERNQIDKVFSEMKFQMSGMTTTDAVEIGKVLNANFILVGSVNKLGNILIITTKVINVESGQIEGSREVQCTSATIEDISDMVMLLAPSITSF